MSSGAGPLTVSTGTGWRSGLGLSGGATRRGPTRAELAAYERELKRAEREASFARALDLERGLISAHQEDFRPASRPVIQALPVNRTAIEARHEEAAKSATSAFKRKERRAALDAASEAAAQEIEAEEKRRAELCAAEQRRADELWERLQSNDPEAVINALDEAFEDNSVTAVPIDCQSAAVTVVLLFPTVEEIPDRTPDRTDAGTAVTRKRSKTERNTFYLAMLASHALATAKEAFAVAPGINEVRLIVARHDRRRSTLAAIWCGSLWRGDLDTVDWSDTSGFAYIVARDDALFETRGRTKEVQAIDLDDHPDVASVLTTLAYRLAGIEEPEADEVQERAEAALTKFSDSVDELLSGAREPVAAQKGSQRRMQEWINWRPADLDRALESWPSLDRWRVDLLEWLSPVRENDFRELQDDLWSVAKLPGPTPQEDGFWPRRGPVWDGVGIVPGPDGQKGLLLIEAKSHAAELASPAMKASSENSRATITAAMAETKAHLGVPADAAWTSRYYQVTNRLAFLYYLRVRRSLPAWLLSIYFTGDAFETGKRQIVGPEDEAGWEEPIKLANQALQIPEEHSLSEFTRHIFLPADPDVVKA